MPFEELKARQAVMWGSGPYERITAAITPMHVHVVERLEPRPGERWLDVATGTGKVAQLAAKGGADVTAQDLAPGLVETAERLAAESGVEIRFEVGDAERLPYADASFDVVSSAIGCMFCPDHAAVARELARVCRPGGRLGVSAWKPGAGVQDYFKTMAPFGPPPVPGIGNPFDWGREEHVEGLLGERFELEFEEGDSPQTGESGEQLWELFSTSYGPTKTLADSLEPERRAELASAMIALYESHRVDDGILQPRPYVLALGTRRAS